MYSCGNGLKTSVPSSESIPNCAERSDGQVHRKPEVDDQQTLERLECVFKPCTHMQ
jgi:hypothetical protein